MIEETNIEETNIIELYSGFDLKQKRKLLADEIFELVSVIKKMKSDLNLPDEDPENEILKELYNLDRTEEEYIISLYKNVIALKDELADYLTVIMDSLYEEKNTD